MSPRRPSRQGLPGRRLILLAALAAACTATSADDRPNLGGSAGDAASGSAGGGVLLPPAYAPRCRDGSLRCRKVDCPADSSPSTTSVSGHVYDPAGRVPLYNAVVYVAEESELKALDDRAQCEDCSAHFPKSATAVALTKSDGSFRLTDMPVGDDVPLIVQLGKWRRLVKLPHVAACTDTRLEPSLTRLPRSSSEGHIPKIAVTTGGSDALECLLQRIGVDASEFTPDDGAGRVHLFAGYGAARSMLSGDQTRPLHPAEDLWADSTRMLGYDMLLMSCEGSDNLWNALPDELPEGATLRRPPAMQLEVRKYADQGGRIFGSHWHHRWINSDDTTPDSPYPPVAQFAKSAKDIGDVTVSVDTSFPKGVAFRDWLAKVGASTKPGQLDVIKAEHSVDAVDGSLAQRWIYGIDTGGEPGKSRVPEMVQYFSFTTPVGATECGRMVFSDVHVTLGGGDYATLPFPKRCDASPDAQLTPQEKALEFMIFDLSSCIQKEDAEPSRPITIVK